MPSPTTTLHEELNLMTRLLNLLKEEQQQLISIDVNGLEALTAQKNQLISTMAALAQQRHQALAAAGLNNADAAMSTWFSTHPDTTASANWQELLTATREAKEMNRLNGMLVNKQLAHNHTLIKAMRTPANAPEAGLYGANGQTTSSPISRRFVVG